MNIDDPISRPENETNIASWIRKNAETQALLMRYLELDQLRHLFCYYTDVGKTAYYTCWKKWLIDTKSIFKCKNGFERIHHRFENNFSD